MSNDANAKWIRVTPEEAARHPLYGVSGWLAFLGAVHGLSFVRLLREGALEPIDKTGLPSDYALFADIELGGNFLIAGWMLLNLILLFSRARAFRASALAFFVFSFLFTYGDTATAYLLLSKYDPSTKLADLVSDPQILVGLITSAVALLIWGSYVRVSERVNVTYLHRVKPESLKLVRGDRMSVVEDETPPPASPIVG
jgi:hypothetical protein